MTNLTENKHLSAFPEIITLLQELLKEVQHILDDHFVGMYLEGSLTGSDFDQDSDIDFVVVTDEDVSEDDFSALQGMHDRINQTDTKWAINLEGSYMSQDALRRHDPKHANHPNMERGPGERLKMVHHDEAWIIHRYILRERGITIIGPAPKTLVDPISPNELRLAMLPTLQVWATHILDHPDEIARRGYQSLIVLSLCRILYTLQLGDIVSKARAAKWVQETTGEKWRVLIDRAWTGRHSPRLEAEQDDINQTLEFIRYTLEYAQKLKYLKA